MLLSLIATVALALLCAWLTRHMHPPSNPPK